MARHRMLGYLSVSLLTASALPASLAQDRPQALLNLEAYRATLRTGEVEWSLVDNTEKARSYRGTERLQTSQFAGEDLIELSRGDGDGVVARDVAGNPALHVGTMPQNVLCTGGSVWQRADAPFELTDVFAEGLRGREMDLRTLGVGAGMSYSDIHDCLWRNFTPYLDPWKYEQAREGDLDVVRVRKGGDTQTYWLDPARAGSPVRGRYERKNGTWFETRSSLKKMDGVWFPEVVQMFNSNYEGGREAARTVRVYSAKFNRPDQPLHLTPADIGVAAGAEIIFRDKDQPDGQHLKWDGENLVTPAEFNARGLSHGPDFAGESARLEARIATERRTDATPVAIEAANAEALRRVLHQRPTECQSLWEAYTRNFIKKYQLNDEQTQRALAILRECQDAGRAYVTKHKPEFESLDERTKNLSDLDDESARQKQRAAIQGERDNLTQPIDDIFEKQLKPRLDKLPTRAQRKAAEHDARQEPGASRAAEPGTKPATARHPKP